MMAPQLVASQTPRLFAQAGEIDTEPPIGQVQDIVGTAAIIRDGVPVELLIGDPVFRNDVVQTGLESDLTIGFADGTIFTLASNARITLVIANYFALDAERHDLRPGGRRQLAVLSDLYLR